MALSILVTRRRLRIRQGGRLQPWLGPALRGLTGHFLRVASCRQPYETWSNRWKYCHGCPLMKGCAYGETYEPDPPRGVPVAAGWEQIARPVVIAPDFPLPERVPAGYEFEVTVLFLGPRAQAHCDTLWQALARGGSSPYWGLGQEHVVFELGPYLLRQQFDVTLPEEFHEGTHHALRVCLTAPLFLRTRAERQRQWLRQPSFADLLRAGLRALGPLYQFYGAMPLPSPLFRRLKEASQHVTTLATQFEPFDQYKTSGRGHSRVQLKGLIGEARYCGVPEGLIPWLQAAGLVHVGMHRIAGAGGWTVEPLPVGANDSRKSFTAVVGVSSPPAKDFATFPPEVTAGCGSTPACSPSPSHLSGRSATIPRRPVGR